MNNLTTETILCKLVLGKQYCLVVIDAFTKFVWTETLATKESKGSLRKFTQNIQTWRN